LEGARFSFKLNPPKALLRWFVANPSELQPLSESEAKRREVDTRRKRSLLLGGDGEMLKTALREVEKSSGGSLKSEWWRFERYITADCVLLTSSAAILVHDVTSEDDPEQNPWYPVRRYVFRSLDCIQAFASLTKRSLSFMLDVVREPLDVQEHLARTITLLTDKTAQARSLPHLAQHDRERLISTYLGSVSALEVDQLAAGGGIAGASGIVKGIEASGGETVEGAGS
jgi:hypothetical protein